MKRPNILIFCTDQQRANHIGCAEDSPLQTPSIDALAERGTRFDNAFCASPVCMVARATMFTGQSNRGNNMRQHGMGLPEGIPTFPELLADAGYRTHSSGKLHLKPWGRVQGVDLEDIETPQENPERRWHWPKYDITESPDNYYGFQTQDMVPGHGHYSHIGGDYGVWLKERAPQEAEKYTAGTGSIELDPELHYNKWIADRSLDFLSDQADSEDPFFLWCSFPDPHTPFAALEEYADLYDVDNMPLSPARLEVPNGGQCQTLAQLGKGTAPRDPDHLREVTRQIYGMMTHVDEQIGRVLSGLEKHGLAENTVVMLISDHGELLGDHGHMHKGFPPYDGSTRIPFIAALPETMRAERGQVVDEVVSQYDLMPTVLDLAAVAHPEDPRSTPEHRECFDPLPDSLPGESLVGVLQQDKSPQRGTALIEYDSDEFEEYEMLQMRTLVRKDFKLAHYTPTGEVMLFDRRRDPYEMNNLAHDPDHQDVVREMLNEMVQQINRTEPRLPRRFSYA